jgi:hypothetical protein
MTTTWDSHTLEELADMRRSLDVAIWDRVQAHRAAGETWQVIADQLRVARQEAHRRYRASTYPLTDPPVRPTTAPLGK